MSAGGLVTRPWRLLPLPWSILLGYQGSEERYFYLQCQDLNNSVYINMQILQHFNQQYQTQTLEFCPYKEYLGKVEFRDLADSWTILPNKTRLTIDKYLWDLTSLLRLGVCGKFAPPKLTRSVLVSSNVEKNGTCWQGLASSRRQELGKLSEPPEKNHQLVRPIAGRKLTCWQDLASSRDRAVGSVGSWVHLESKR